MEENNIKYYLIRLKDTDNKKNNNIDNLEGIIIDVISGYNLNGHRYYLSFLDGNQNQYNFYRIKSIKSFLSLLLDIGYEYLLEPTNEGILNQISNMSNEEYKEKIMKSFINANEDKRTQIIYDYLSSSDESYQIDQTNENNVSNIFERKNK